MLFPHQKEAIQWMRLIETQPRVHQNQPVGGILAHEMGLGKTVTMLNYMSQSASSAAADKLNLVICPKSVLMHWQREAVSRQLFTEEQLFLYYGSNRKQLWNPETCQVVLTTFDIARMESSMKKTSPLFTTHWKRIVLDEAHRISERSSKTSKSIAQLNSGNRWCLTGTPYKNGLSDIMALCKFLKIPPYCKSSWWRTNAHNDFNLQLWRATFLHLRHKSSSFLPPVVSKVQLVPNTFAEAHVQNTVRNIQLNSDNRSKVQEFELLKILRMRQSAVHPFLFLSEAARKHLLFSAPCVDNPDCCSACLSPIAAVVVAPPAEVEVFPLSQEDDASLLPSLLPSLPAPVAPPSTELPMELPRDDQKPWMLHFDKGTTTIVCQDHVLCHRCSYNTLMCPTCMALSLPRSVEESWLHSNKTRELLRRVTKVVAKGHKLVLFSQWTTCLDLVGSMLTHYHIEYARFDGAVNTLEERNRIVQSFGESETVLVLLTSLGAGGEGIDLTCANTVILLEPYWNSAMEQQAIDRVHRLGQKDVTRVYKLTLQSSIEEWVLELQKCKLQEQLYYLQGTPPTALVLPVTSNSLVKRHEKLMNKIHVHGTSGGGAAGGGKPVNTWKSMAPPSSCTTPKTSSSGGNGNLLSKFIL